MKAQAKDWVGRNFLKGPVNRLVAPYLARPFSRSAMLRVQVYYEPNKISFSQIFPFFYYARELREKYGTEFRFAPSDSFLQDTGTPPTSTDIILLQTWFDVDQRRLDHALDRLKSAHPATRIAFLDSFAHNDLRLARTLDPYIDHYVKKSIFHDRELYFTPLRGDTNLTQFYGDLYGIQADPVDWQVPRTILSKLRLGAGFFTGPGLISAFTPGALPALQNRNLDIHARLGGKGDSWYGQMRKDAIVRIRALQGYQIASQGNVDWASYMAEMRDAKLCFSPFGYGELCWRDIEAYLTGAVLIKPDMSHLETLPTLFEPDQTYAAINWEMTDLETVIDGLIRDESRRAQIARNAFDRVSTYLARKEFVTSMGFLFTH